MEPPEELPLGFMEPAKPPSASVYLEMPPTPHAQGGEDDDRVLSYISRRLMEEDTGVDKLLHQYPDDHPALLQLQQQYAQILAEASSDALDSWPWGSIKLSPLQPVAVAHSCSGNIDTLASDMLSSCTQCSNMDNTLFFNGTTAAATYAVERSSMSAVNMAFFEGVEEANTFLPGGSDDTVVARGRKKRLKDDDEVEAEAGMGRRSNQMAVLAKPESEEEDTAREMLERLMLNGYDARFAVAGVQEPRVNTRIGKPPRARRAVDLHKMLVRCAEAVSINDQRCAADLLLQIKHHSSPMGDNTQRLAHCFAKGLEARLAGIGSQLCRTLMTKRASTASVLKAYQLYTSSTCFLKIQLLYSNQIIYNAIEGGKKLHVVQYGLRRWFQWPDLLRQLAHREGAPPMVRLTAIDTPQPGFRPAQLIEEIGHWLSNCAQQFGVSFEFRGIAAKSENVRVEDLGIDPDEILVVNTLFHLGTLMDENVIVDMPNPKDMVLSTIRKMRPKVFIHAIDNGSSNTGLFLTRFRQALFHCSALFDMANTIMPQYCEKRLLLEQFYARYAMNIIACEGVDRVERHQSYKQWQVRSQQAGLRQLPLDLNIVRMLKDKVKKECHKYFFLIDEDDRWLLEGWKGRVLYALSTWTADDDQSDLT
ncbi:hypothetical protein ACP70R_018515 [Stipagrostis hirtigluma subsp. patula]